MNQQLRVQPGAAPGPEGWLKTVQELRAAGKQQQALAILVPMLNRPGAVLEAFDHAAMCYFELGDTDTAISLVQVMLEKWPENGAVWAKMASMQQAKGDREQALEFFRKALAVNPNQVRALSSLNGLAPFARNSQKTARLKKLAASKALPPADRALALNTLGVIERRHQRPAPAMRYFRKSKEAYSASYDPGRTDAVTDEQTAVFEAQEPAAGLSQDPPVIFVCGMPRSGTTLTEAILGRHSDTGSIGESKALGTVLREVRRYCAEKGRGATPWSWFGKLTAEEISIFRKYYYEVALQGQQPGRVVIDKMPLNCRVLGLAHVLMPEARFVFLSRHPLDVGLSNFSTSYREVMPFSCRLDWIANMTRNVYRSALDYQAKLGSQIRVQSYQALVSDPDRQIRDLVAHCGLDWQDACLSPEENAGRVDTASVLQVREKINTEGLGKWRAFEKELEPLTMALGGAAWLSQWQDWDDHAAGTGRFA